MTMKLLISTTLTVILISNQVSLIKSEHGECPDFKLYGDFHDPHFYKKVQENIFTKLWSTEWTTLTKDMILLKNVLSDMLYSGKQELSDTAMSITYLVSAYLPYAEKKLDLCAYSEVIDATVEKLETGHCTRLSKALTGISQELIVGGKMALETGYKTTQCHYEFWRVLEHIKYKCVDAHISKTHELWKLVGHKYPDEFEKVVKALLISHDERENLIGILATSTISEWFLEIIKHFNRAKKAQVFKMMTIGKLPEYCCEKYIHESELLVKFIEEEVVRIVDLVKHKTNCY